MDRGAEVHASTMKRRWTWWLVLLVLTGGTTLLSLWWWAVHRRRLLRGQRHRSRASSPESMAVGRSFVESVIASSGSGGGGGAAVAVRASERCRPSESVSGKLTTTGGCHTSSSAAVQAILCECSGRPVTLCLDGVRCCVRCSRSVRTLSLGGVVD